LVAAGLTAIVAMQFPVSDLAAIEFGRTLYQQLGKKASLDAAVAEARSAVAALGSGEWATPAVFLRCGDGWLWQREDTAGQAVPHPTIMSENRIEEAKAQDMSFIGSDEAASGSSSAGSSVHQITTIGLATAEKSMVFVARKRGGSDD
jgi:hypothetical protein